ncbi:MAG: DUF1295 domain-containing protein [Flavobacterium sp.]|uniref:methyltransferase family protein n=1 Tax=Flavobacterium sp. TaxID=239 RepID=UPI00121FD94C|nr:isoprenylcysteine carboxylmethyltransferase family protein [Flavobacterium sp.]RZJ67173.1 MAG: DUF1295 domain-containing protein [Flavobacterium sp.]
MSLSLEIEKQGNWLFRYRSYLPLLILPLGIGIHLYNLLDGSFAWSKSGANILWFELLCLSVSVLGLVVRGLTVGCTPKNTSGRNVHEQIADYLNTTGMYSLVRHPLYLGNFLSWLGIAMFTGSFGFVIAFCLAFWLYYERIMFAEESFLTRKFGQQYIDWAAQTPAFVPKVTGFRSSGLPFSWKKVLKKEKNGLAAIFLVFLLFDISRNLIFETATFSQLWMFGTFASGIVYLILKILKKRTCLLNEDGR